MKKQLLFSTILMLLCIFTHAKHINEQTAKIVGQTFLNTKTNSQQLIGANNLNLAYEIGFTSNLAPRINEPNQRTFFYVFNVSYFGYIIVSGDDQVTPILAYSDQGNFHPNNIPNNAKKILEEYKTQIRDVIENQIPATEEITSEWNFLKNGGNSTSPTSVLTVNPLVQAQWNQNPFYNALCPGGSVTGCVATAMAQIMKFWNYPATGSGFHSYNHSTYGTLSSNFGSTTYNWASMPNSIFGSNTAIATLMLHCGISVNMDYSPQVSGAYVISAMSPIQNCSEYAMKTYFGYKNTMQGVQRVNYNQTQWINLLKAELNAGRPILYAGFGSGGGHAFVCDGYDNNNFFHFNWGWGGAYDGYFSINALNPSGTGTGGGSGGYNSGHQALIGIEPPTTGGSITNNLGLFNSVIPSASTIAYGAPFSITTNIANLGTNTFNGDYSAAVFNSQGTFIDYVQILSGYTLQGGYVYSNNLVFSNSGLFSMLPGTYTIRIFYRPTGGNWVLVSNNSGYVNSTQITVVNTNSIRLNSTILVSPGTTLTQGQTASVNLNILNASSTTFYGLFDVVLYNLDGTFAQTIGSYNESTGLPPNNTYLAPFLTFNNAITASPGTYLLAVSHKPNNSPNWQLTGSTSTFINPITVIVQSANIAPDPYEVNNTIAQAYTLPVSFAANTATRNTVGSNLHIRTDNDYYKIQLSPGYNYSINARLHDSYNSGNGIVYTGDALFSYSLDGVNWSSAFDDVMSGPINVFNGGTVYYHVAPFFAGEKGTYLLDMIITRTGNVSVSENTLNHDIKVFPNPTKDNFQIDFGNEINLPTNINLLNLHGQVLSTKTVDANKQIVTLPVHNYPNGIYLIRISTSNGIITKKVTIQK